jgi:hypothetical protein
MLQGYGGFRARAARLDWRPVLAPHILKTRFVRLAYAGAVYSVEYSDTAVAVTLHSAGTNGLSLCTPLGSEDCEPLAVEVPRSLRRGGFSLMSGAGLL